MQQAAQQMQQMPPGKRMKAMPESAAKRAASPQRQSRRGAAKVSYIGMDDSADMGAGDTEDEEDQDTPNETFSRRSSMGGALKSADPAQQTQYAKNQKAWERRARDVLKRQSKNIKDRVTSGHSPQRMSIDEVTSLLVNDTTKTKDKPGVVIWNAERIRKFCEKRNFGILVTDEKRGEKRAHDDTASGGQGAAEVQLLPSPAVVFTNLTLSYRDSIANIFRQESPNIGSVSSDALEWLDVQLTDFLKQLLSGLTSTTSITVLKARAEVLMGKNSEVTKLVNREIDRRVGSYTSNEENEVEMSACEEEEEEEQFDPKKVKAVGPALDIQMCVGIAALLECLCAEILELAAYTKMDEEADRCGVPRRAASLT